MLLEGAIGDAYGAGFEFAEIEKIKAKNNITAYEIHPLFEEIKGKYTDDTQMSLAVAELLIEGKEWTALSIANKFVEVFKRDPRRGYAKRFYQFLYEIKDGQELLDNIHPKSERNGAAMRAYPIGILKNEKEILSKTELQASVTHQTEKAILAAQTIALTSHFFIYDKGKISELLIYLSDILDYEWKANWQGEVRVEAIETVEAVLTILTKESNLKSMLKKSVDFGGDVDTVASLALAIGKMNKNVENNLPSFLYDELENGNFGRDYIKKIDKELYQLKDARKNI
ncbi:ADP-ribosylglycohydrolase family protein [Bernardetia sp.]|uniref:ADP-ribosylglycohydrolase family protein n=1 Tax=Bernardetia sp. TaxID=1937974 RepID=UPI0025BA14B5|nr:ADP-ribosylglycohydrolase family protein [Bernardetia sp.]